MPAPGPASRLLLWFTWPTLPLSAWTLWRWRGHWTQRHISIPLGSVLVGLAASAAMGGSDRALLLAVPGLAILAAFSLPTLQRGASAAIDWFSVFFFSLSALVVWVIYSSIQLNLPPSPCSTCNAWRRASSPPSPPCIWLLRWPAPWRGCGWCAGAPRGTGTRCGRAWCCPPAAWP
jgi:hypothetical protein